VRDLASNISVVLALTPAVLAATTKGIAVDRLGFESVAFAINTGAIAGAGLFAAKLQESDTTTDGDFTDVAAGNQVGTLPETLAAASAYKAGYIGNKRYVRVVATQVSGTSIAAGAVAILGNATSRPVA
jgi:hypothetical protein